MYEMSLLREKGEWTSSIWRKSNRYKTGPSWILNRVDLTDCPCFRLGGGKRFHKNRWVTRSRWDWRVWVGRHGQRMEMNFQIVYRDGGPNREYVDQNPMDTAPTRTQNHQVTKRLDVNRRTNWNTDSPKEPAPLFFLYFHQTSFFKSQKVWRAQTEIFSSCEHGRVLDQLCL